MSTSIICEATTPITTTNLPLREYLKQFQRFWSFPSPEVNPFTSAREEVYKYLANRNLSQLKACLPDTLLDDVVNRSLSKNGSFLAAENFERAFFYTTYSDFPNIGELMQSRQMDHLDALNEENIYRITQGKKSMVNRLINSGVTALLIRPEIIHIKGLVHDFLEERGFQVVYQTPKSIDFAHYWALYTHVFSDPVKEAHVRRRALGYVDRPTELLLFTDQHQRYGTDAVSLADGIKRDYKGVAGAYDYNTLRGGIIYAEMTMARIGYNTTTDLALDPLRQYHYADKSVYSMDVRSHILANLPGVHIPEGHEVEKDLGILLELDELRNL